MGTDSQATPKRMSPWPIVLVSVGAFLVILLLGVGAVYNSPRSTPTPTAQILPDIERISVDRAYQAFVDYQAVFLDVRDLVSYETNHIRGAIHIPLNQLDERLGELASEAWIITYCACEDEETSAAAAQILLENGFERVNPMTGGLDAWITAGYPAEGQR